VGAGAAPGAVHDLSPARIWGIIRELAASGLVPPGDKGYIGEDDIRTPHRGRNKPASQKDANRGHARLCALGERANAPLRAGGSCGSSAAAPGAPGNWPRPSTSFRPAKSQDDKRSRKYDRAHT
jgi:hypothetical protein